jgi:hypothetical protein
MIFDPEITFHMPGQIPVTSGSGLWDMPLSGKTGTENSRAEWTIGDYFEAAHTFLTRGQGEMVCHAVSCLAPEPGPIHALNVCLEKHGAFYHPLKITAVTGSATVFLVLNGAVRDPGLTLIETECRLLADLADRVEPAWIPRVFGAKTFVEKKGRIGFFLGQWFDRFCEFHITRTGKDYQVAIWKDDGTHEPVPWHRAEKIYEQIACVLTDYYEKDTGLEIFPWHLAAGDFVVNSHDEVRLITVRGIGQLTETASDICDVRVRQLFCLLLYFLNLTLCMRLDRVDGTGSLAWLPDRVVDAAVKGMIRSLKMYDQKNTPLVESDGLTARFLEFVKRFDSAQLHDMLIHLLEDRHFTAGEVQLIRKHLDAHCERIQKTVSAL